jgi:hypothetical protein
MKTIRSSVIGLVAVSFMIGVTYVILGVLSLLPLAFGAVVVIAIVWWMSSGPQRLD